MLSTARPVGKCRLELRVVWVDRRLEQLGPTRVLDHADLRDHRREALGEDLGPPPRQEPGEIVPVAATSAAIRRATDQGRPSCRLARLAAGLSANAVGKSLICESRT